MPTTQKLFRALLLAITVIPVGAAGITLATSGSGLSSANVSVGLFPPMTVHTNVDGQNVVLATNASSDIYVVSNVFAPGGQSGWHTHPGASLITVKSGAISVYDGDDPTCTATVYTAGQGFVDPGDGHVHLLRNEGSVAAETVAVQFLPHGAVRRIDAPDPGSCAF
jgi:quercetin dioxygenase-like cupin family protein